MENRSEIKRLLEKYFEGATSLQEEQRLRDYFSSKTIDDEYSKYIPLFQHFTAERTAKKNRSRFYNKTMTLRWSLVGAAAGVLLALGIFLSPDRHLPAPVVEDEFGCSGTYVRIEGTCYNDINLVFSHAAQAISDLDILLAEDHSSININHNEQ
jgi:hypothetical protein